MHALKTRSDLEARFTNAVLLHGIVIAIAIVFELTRRTSSRFRRAVESCQLTYVFRAGSSVRHLIIENGRVTTRRGPRESPDFELVFLDPRGSLRQLAAEPGNVMQLLVENKIDQTGNVMVLFQLGYLMSLCEQHIRQFASWGSLGLGD